MTNFGPIDSLSWVHCYVHVGDFTVDWGVYGTLQSGILQHRYDYYKQTSGFIKFVWSVGTKLSLILLPKCGFICPPKNYPSNLISTDALPAETTRPHGPLLAKARSVLAIIDLFGWVSGLGCWNMLWVWVDTVPCMHLGRGGPAVPPPVQN